MYESTKLQEQYDIEDQIGSGTYSVVLSAKQKKTQRNCAVKIIDNINPLNKQQIQREFLNISNVKSDHIVEYSKIFYDEQNHQIQMIMNRIEKNLRTIIQDQWTLEKITKFIIQIVSGFQKLSKHKVVHLDLKPQNILVDKNNYFKICDFGCSLIAENSIIRISNLIDVGTKNYVPPELILSNQSGIYRSQTDIWSFGIILYEIIYKRHPFSQEKNDNNKYNLSIEKLQNFYTGKQKLVYPDIPQYKPIINIMKKMLTNKNQPRIKWNQIKQSLINVLILDIFPIEFNDVKDNFMKHVSLMKLFDQTISMIKIQTIQKNHQFFIENQNKLISLNDVLVRCMYIYTLLFKQIFSYKYLQSFTQQQINILRQYEQKAEAKEKQYSKGRRVITKIEDRDFLEHQILVDLCTSLSHSLSKIRQKDANMSFIQRFCQVIIQLQQRKLSLFCQGDLFEKLDNFYNEVPICKFMNWF